jgi:hypothetical protein
MEVWAVLDALTTFFGDPVGTVDVPGGGPADVPDDVPDDLSVTVVSDSTYVVNCFRDSWHRGWIARGWKNSQKQPVANQDLWKPLVALYLKHKDRIQFEWVKGHSGNPMNDRVDALAVAAAAGQTVRTLIDPDGWFTPARPEPASVFDASSVTPPAQTQQGSLF